MEVLEGFWVQNFFCVGKLGLYEMLIGEASPPRCSGSEGLKRNNREK